MKSRGFLNWIYYIVVFLLIVILLNNFMSKSDRIFKVVGFRTYTILSGSMEPKIKTGDLVFVKSISFEDVKKGDIITFKYEGNVVTHRVIDKKEDGFITKGDNNNVQDKDVVGEEDLIGKVLFHIPFLGYITVFLSKPIVISSFMILIAISILFDSFRGSKKKREI